MQALTSYPLTVKDAYRLPCKKGELPLDLSPSSGTQLPFVCRANCWCLATPFQDDESFQGFLFSSWPNISKFPRCACSLSYRNFQGLFPETWYTTVAITKDPLCKRAQDPETEQVVHNSDFLKGGKTKAPRLFLQVPLCPLPSPAGSFPASSPSLCFNPEHSSVSFSRFFSLASTSLKRCPKSPSIFFLFLCNTD